MNKEDHKKLAINLFNKTWDFMERNDLSEDDIYDMIHHAHASRYHWGIAGTDLNKARGEWQIARVYALQNMGESSLFHAKKYLKMALENSYTAFDKAFGYEGVARAYKVLGDIELYKLNLELGFKASNDIESKDDKDYTIGELNKL